MFSIYALDANAWGFYIHIYFAQWFVLAAPFLDPKIQYVIKKFPTLIMAVVGLGRLFLKAKLLILSCILVNKARDALFIQTLENHPDKTEHALSQFNHYKVIGQV